jgi:cytochrome c-type biogenesis protein CcmH
MHRRVESLQDAGMNADQIVAAFVRDYGDTILMAPPKEGFNLAAYFVPSIVIIVAGTLLTLALRRWTRAPAPVPAGPETASTAASPDELARLQRELDQIDA